MGSTCLGLMVRNRTANTRFAKNRNHALMGITNYKCSSEGKMPFSGMGDVMRYDRLESFPSTTSHRRTAKKHRTPMHERNTKSRLSGFWHVIGHHVYMPSAASLGMTYECHLSRPAKHDKPSLTPYSLTLSCALVTFESSMEPLSRMLLLSKRYRSTLPLQ